MKNKSFLAFTLLCLFSGCQVFKKTPDQLQQYDAVQLNGKWQILELENKKIPTHVNGIQPSFTINYSENTYSTITGCNNIAGKIQFSHSNKVKFDRGMSTMMACDNMDVEQSFSKIIPSISNYQLRTDTLLLLNDKNIVLAKFKAKKENISTLLQGKWILDKIYDSKATLDELFHTSLPYIEFDSKEETIIGNGSCNRYSGTYNLNGTNIKFGAIAATKMACNTLNGESLYFKHLNNTTSVTVEDDHLTFYQNGQKTLKFKKTK